MEAYLYLISFVVLILILIITSVQIICRNTKRERLGNFLFFCIALGFLLVLLRVF